MAVLDYGHRSAEEATEVMKLGTNSTEPCEPIVSIPVADIVTGDRARTNVGNVLGLVESIKRLGLLHPIVLNTRRELVAGGRRLAAVKKLGWTDVPCRVVDTLDDAVAALQAERDENTCREQLVLEDFVALGRRIEALEKPKAKARKNTGTNQHTEASGKLPEASKGDTRDKVAGALGVSGRTYEKAKQIVEAAEAEPERFGDLPALAKEQSVSAAHSALKLRRAPEPVAKNSNAGKPEGAEQAERVQKERAKAFTAANDAINDLMKVRRDNPGRAEAFAMVRRWMKNNSGDTPTAPDRCSEVEVLYALAAPILKELEGQAPDALVTLVSKMRDLFTAHVPHVRAQHETKQ